MGRRERNREPAASQFRRVPLVPARRDLPVYVPHPSTRETARADPDVPRYVPMYPGKPGRRRIRRQASGPVAPKIECRRKCHGPPRAGGKGVRRAGEDAETVRTSSRSLACNATGAGSVPPLLRRAEAGS